VYTDGHVSRSVYVALPVVEKSPGLAQVFPKDVKLAIWTTTPWTLPANAGVNINVDMEYLISKDGLVYAEDRQEELQQELGELVAVARIKGEYLVDETPTIRPRSCRYKVPDTLPAN
jgi:isoleucyl-tRNA synthetase